MLNHSSPNFDLQQTFNFDRQDTPPLPITDMPAESTNLSELYSGSVPTTEELSNSTPNHLPETVIPNPNFPKLSLRAEFLLKALKLIGRHNISVGFLIVTDPPEPREDSSGSIAKDRAAVFDRYGDDEIIIEEMRQRNEKDKDRYRDAALYFLARAAGVTSQKRSQTTAEGRLIQEDYEIMDDMYSGKANENARRRFITTLKRLSNQPGSAKSHRPVKTTKS